jgi:hypothetical protein
MYFVVVAQTIVVPRNAHLGGNSSSVFFLNTKGASDTSASGALPTARNRGTGDYPPAIRPAIRVVYASRFALHGRGAGLSKRGSNA